MQIATAEGEILDQFTLVKKFPSFQKKYDGIWNWIPHWD